MGDGRARIPIVGEPSPGARGRGALGVAGSSHEDAGIAEFKRTVRERQIEYLVDVKKRTFIPDLPDSELEKIEVGGKHRMRKEAALACRELLAAARGALATAQSGGNAGAARTTGIGVQSAYRSIREDTAAWEKTFDDYYKEMVEQETFAGNELGAGALEHMTRLMISFKAPPGYSNHSNGLAVDFNTTHAKVQYQAKKSQNPGWKKTWFHQWLLAKDEASVSNAARFGFAPLATEAWHWDYDAALRNRNAAAPAAVAPARP